MANISNLAEEFTIIKQIVLYKEFCEYEYSSNFNFFKTKTNRFL